VNPGEPPAIRDHLSRFGSNDFGADITVDNIANFPDLFFHRNAFSGDEGGICRNAFDNSPSRGSPQLFEIGAIEKNLHLGTSFANL
jgi:hypothetical protein